MGWEEFLNTIRLMICRSRVCGGHRRSWVSGELGLGILVCGFGSGGSGSVVARVAQTGGFAMLTQVWESFVGFDGSVTNVEEFDIGLGVSPRVQEGIVKHGSSLASLSEEGHELEFG